LLEDLKAEHIELDRWKQKWMKVDKERAAIQELYDTTKHNQIDRDVYNKLKEELKAIDDKFDEISKENQQLKSQAKTCDDLSDKLKLAEDSLKKLSAMERDCIETKGVLKDVQERYAQVKKALDDCSDERDGMRADLKDLPELRRLLKSYEIEHVRLKKVEEEFEEFKKFVDEQQQGSSHSSRKKRSRPDIDAPFGGDEFV
jgi:chromosome segregation ATPase